MKRNFVLPVIIVLSLITHAYGYDEILPYSSFLFTDENHSTITFSEYQCRGQHHGEYLFPDTENEEAVWILPAPAKGLCFRATAWTTNPVNRWKIQNGSDDGFIYLNGIKGATGKGHGIQLYSKAGDSIVLIAYEISPFKYVWNAIPISGMWAAY